MRFSSSKYFRPVSSTAFLRWGVRISRSDAVLKIIKDEADAPLQPALDGRFATVSHGND